MNSNITQLIEQTAWALLNADGEYQAFQAAYNRIVASVRNKVDEDAFGILEDALIQGSDMMLDILLPLALEIGRNPSKLFDLPETSGMGVLVDKA